MYAYASTASGSTNAAAYSDPADGARVLDTLLQYDAHGWLVRKYEGTPDKDRCSTFTAEYAYDTAGNLVAVKVLDPDGKHSFTLAIEWEKGVSSKDAFEAFIAETVDVGC